MKLLPFLFLASCGFKVTFNSTPASQPVDPRNHHFKVMTNDQVFDDFYCERGINSACGYYLTNCKAVLMEGFTGTLECVPSVIDLGTGTAP